MPGQTTGWDFTLDNQTPDWISVTSSALTFESNPSLGFYSDFIGLQGGPLPSFAVAPFDSWSEVFDGASQGLGSYTTFLSSAPFAENTGLVLVSFDVFNGDPTNGGAQTGSSSVTAPFTVDMATELTTMIDAQRGYTANSKVFQTGSELMDVLVNLKR